MWLIPPSFFFGCDHFHPYKRVGWNSSQNYGQFHTLKKRNCDHFHHLKNLCDQFHCLRVWLIPHVLRDFAFLNRIQSIFCIFLQVTSQFLVLKTVWKTLKSKFCVCRNEFLCLRNEFHIFRNGFPYLGGNEFRPKRTKKSLAVNSKSGQCAVYE